MRLERAFRRNPATALTPLPHQSLVSAITIGELQIGVLRAETEGQRNAAREFIELVQAELNVLVFGTEDALVWAQLYDTLRRRGLLIGERDLQIAATALAGGHSVMTGNTAEFSRVPGLDVIPPPDIPPPR